jgi:aryl-alcohol dehydrogenase-like predicted oxidoreductase
MTEVARVEVARVELAPGYSVARIVNGGWQLSAGHGAAPVDVRSAVAAMTRLAEAGFTTFDCADIYSGVEELIGRFLASYPRRSEIQVHTKLVPDKSALGRVDRRYVERIVDRSLKRLGVERLDLVQYHWWDPAVPGAVETALALRELREAGKIRLLGATNFGVRELGAIVEAGVPVAVHQVQYSLLDRRPENGMVDLCAAHGIHLFCYGSLAGGFVSERHLGRGEPADPMPNRSLVKYRLIIEEFGGWGSFQELLGAVKRVADKHGVSVANVAARWTLERPQVAGVIVGARTAEHVRSNLATFGFELDDEDRRLLAAVTSRSAGPAGDVFGLERIPRGRHSAIMKTELNRLDS